MNGNQIRALRERLDLNQHDFGIQILRLPSRSVRNAVSRMEHGRRTPSEAQVALMKVANVIFADDMDDDVKVVFIRAAFDEPARPREAAE